MSHVAALCISDEPILAMDHSIGQGYDYWSDLDGNPELQAIETVGQVQGMTDIELYRKFECIVTDGACYRNQYQIMPPEMVASLFRKVVSAYAPESAARVFDVHV